MIVGLKLYGKCWKRVEAYVGTRSSTQVRSHAQKYFLKKGNQGQSKKAKLAEDAKKAGPQKQAMKLSAVLDASIQESDQNSRSREHESNTLRPTQSHTMTYELELLEQFTRSACQRLSQFGYTRCDGYKYLKSLQAELTLVLTQQASLLPSIADGKPLP